jgi:DNA-directed RNA polymerase beta subunit
MTTTKERLSVVKSHKNASLASHHIDQYNDFMEKDISSLLRQHNPITLSTIYDACLGREKHHCRIYLGGKEGNRIYYRLPRHNDQWTTPHQARLHNLNYSVQLYYDIEMEFEDYLDTGKNDPPFPVTVEFLDKETILGAFESDDGEQAADYTALIRELQLHRDQHPVIPKKGKGKDEEEEKEEEEDEGDELPFVYEGGKQAKKKKVGKKKPKVIEKDEEEPAAEKKTTSLSSKLKEVLLASVRPFNGAYTVQNRTLTLHRVFFMELPIMLHSHCCVLRGLSEELRFQWNENRNDPGGYFIVGGQERFIPLKSEKAENIIQLSKSEKKVITANIYSVTSLSSTSAPPSASPFASLPSASPCNVNIHPDNGGSIDVEIPRIHHPIPLFVLFHALGLSNDLDIIATCLLNRDKYAFMMDHFAASIYAVQKTGVHDRVSAIRYIWTHLYSSSSEKEDDSMMEYVINDILATHFLPHIPHVTEKRLFLGHMVFRALAVSCNLESCSHSANLAFQRVHGCRRVLRDCVSQAIQTQNNTILFRFEETIRQRQEYTRDLSTMFLANYVGILNNNIVHTHMQSFFPSLPVLQRHSHLATLRQLRQIHYRDIHTTSDWGFLDPLDIGNDENCTDVDNEETPNHHAMSMTMVTTISNGYDGHVFIKWLYRECDTLVCPIADVLSSPSTTKIMVNGYW